MSAVRAHPWHDFREGFHPFSKANGALKTVREDIDVAWIAVIVRNGSARDDFAVWQCVG
jgi:hypothetical protein